MGLLPDIGPNGEVIYSKEDLLIRKQMMGDNFIDPERKRILRENMERIKAKHLEKEIQDVDKKMGDLNNMGHRKVTPDFEDSPFADRQPIAPEVEEDVEPEAEEDEDEEEKQNEEES